MTRRSTSHRLRGVPIVAILGLVLTGMGLLIWRASPPQPRPIVPREPPASQRSERQTEIAVALALPSPLTTPDPAAPSPSSDNEDLIAGAGEENHVPGAKPHPITPEHVRLQEEVALFKVGSDAVATKDVPEIRRIVREHRASYPDQNQDMADGYEILADCIEQPGAASTARARRFFDEETYSMMRRPILRTCLEDLR